MKTLHIDELRDRFGLETKTHPVGMHKIRIAEIRQVDDLVRELYPGAVYRHGDAPVWMITWPAALGLAQYVLENFAVSGLRVLELGCGTAAPSIALAKAGAQVLCTDYDPLGLTLARWNARQNGCDVIRIQPLDWHAPACSGQFDIIVGSEVTYFEKSFGALVDLLTRFLDPDGHVVLADQFRPQMERFCALCISSGFHSTSSHTAVYLPDKTQPVRITVLTRRSECPGRDPGFS